MVFKGFHRLSWSVMAALRGAVANTSVRSTCSSQTPAYSRCHSYSTAVGGKPELKTGPNVAFHEMPIINIKVSTNNTMFLMSDHSGKTLFWVSAGSVGFKNAKRGSSHAGEVAGTSCGNKALALGVPKVRVKIKGFELQDRLQ